MRRLLAVIGVTLGIVLPALLASAPDAHHTAPVPAHTLASSAGAGR